jgi:aspartate racemase
MKLIGMLGGLGWEATSRYYRMINEYTQEQLGEQHTARILLHTVDHAAIKYHNSRGDLKAVVTLLADAARSLKNGGADFIIVANNAMHEFAAQIEEASGIDLLHISDPTGREIRDAGYSRVALLGTRATMEGDFYSDRVLRISGAAVITPDLDDRIEINRIIFDELSRGVLRCSTSNYFEALIETLRRRGAEAIVLGCSELTAAVTPDRDNVRIYDTTRLHAKAAAKRALEVSYA